MKPLILFDFDGTIADSLDTFITAANRVAKRRKLTKRVSRKLLRTLPARKVAKHLGVRFWSVPGLLKEVIAEFEASVKAVRPHDHIRGLLKELSCADLGIVSSNSKTVVESFLSAYDLKKYFPVVYGGSIFGKHKIIKKIVSSTKPSATVYVGDEVRDVLAARRANVHSLAVTWGLQGQEVLLKARPTMLATSVDEAKELLLAWAQSRI